MSCWTRQQAFNHIQLSVNLLVLIKVPKLLPVQSKICLPIVFSEQKCLEKYDLLIHPKLQSDYSFIYRFFIHMLTRGAV